MSNQQTNDCPACGREWVWDSNTCGACGFHGLAVAMGQDNDYKLANERMKQAIAGKPIRLPLRRCTFEHWKRLMQELVDRGAITPERMQHDVERVQEVVLDDEDYDAFVAVVAKS